MPLTMNREVFIASTVTASGSRQRRRFHVPRSFAQTADSAIAAASAGATVVQCHVRDPDTGKPARDLAPYRDVTNHSRDADTAAVLNLRTGMGGGFLLDGIIPLPAIVHLCVGVPLDAPDDLKTHPAVVDNVPADRFWAALWIGCNKMAHLAAASLAGVNATIGLEDTLWRDKGVLATNARRVERAVTIIQNIDAHFARPAEVRARLQQTKQALLPLLT